MKHEVEGVVGDIEYSRMSLFREAWVTVGITVCN